MNRLLNQAAWALSIGAVLLAVAAWFDGGGSLRNLSLYRIFPLLGLIAFSLMWAHYVMSALRQKLGIDSSALKTYFEITSLMVLIAILLHPGLLIYQLGSDGFGYTPLSVYENYVVPGLRWAVALGSIALPIFLVYELRRKYGDRRWWKWVSYASDAAMVLVFVHSLALGRHLQAGWFRYVWFLYGASLLLSLGYIYYRRFVRAD